MIFSSGASPASHLGKLGLQTLVWSFKEVDGFLILLPYPEVFVDLEAMPDDGLNEEADGPLGNCIAIVLRYGDGIVSSALGQRKLGGRRQVRIVDVMVPLREGKGRGLCCP